MRLCLVLRALLFSCLLATRALESKGYSPHNFTFFFESYPFINPVINSVTKPSSNNSTSTQNTQNTPNETMPGISGIFVYYFGYLIMSSSSGQITLPRNYDAPSLRFLVTTDIHPIFMFKNTINHWEITANTAYAFYTYDRKQDDQTKLYYWDVKKADLPANTPITEKTIVIFAQPEDVYIPTGISITNNNNQMVLPTIYVKSDKNIKANAVKIMDIRCFFEPIETVKKS